MGFSLFSQLNENVQSTGISSIQEGAEDDDHVITIVLEGDIEHQTLKHCLQYLYSGNNTVLMIRVCRKWDYTLHASIIDALRYNMWIRLSCQIKLFDIFVIIHASCGLCHRTFKAREYMKNMTDIERTQLK